jgi:regulator of cell morphogenesis and NO signaling
MKTAYKQTIGDYVVNDFRTAALFSKYGIDFCCKGNRTLAEACEKKAIDADVLENEINAILQSTVDQIIDFRSWPLDLLIDYILKTHHRYIEEKSAVLYQFLDKLCKVHGGRHPELFEINKLFTAGARELANHMIKEEMVLFPFIVDMVNAQRTNQTIAAPHFGTVYNPIAMMQEEHSIEGERFAKIADLTTSYIPPTDACETYKVTFSMLQAFEADLHKHIHLENNILFPAAKKLEMQLTNSGKLLHA